MIYSKSNNAFLECLNNPKAVYIVQNQSKLDEITELVLSIGATINIKLSSDMDNGLTYNYIILDEVN